MLGRSPSCQVTQELDCSPVCGFGLDGGLLAFESSSTPWTKFHETDLSREPVAARVRAVASASAEVPSGGGSQKHVTFGSRSHTPCTLVRRGATSPRYLKSVVLTYTSHFLYTSCTVIWTARGTGSRPTASRDTSLRFDSVFIFSALSCETPAAWASDQTVSVEPVNVLCVAKLSVSTRGSRHAPQAVHCGPR